jgi:hypothetical protein
MPEMIERDERTAEIYGALLHEFRHSAPGSPKADAAWNRDVDVAIRVFERIYPAQCEEWRRRFS